MAALVLEQGLASWPAIPGAGPPVAYASNTFGNRCCPGESPDPNQYPQNSEVALSHRFCLRVVLMGYWDVAKGNQIVKFAFFLISTTKMKRNAPVEDSGPKPKQATKLFEKGIQITKLTF